MTNKRTRMLVGALLKVFSLGLVVGVGVIAPNAIQIIEKAIGSKDKDKVDKEYNRLINHMKRLDLIDIDRLGDTDTRVNITKKGEQRLKDVYVEDIMIKIPKVWDGMWRIVSFDIPREKKDERYEFLAQLHRLGFVKSLQSMWVYPFPCTEEIHALAKLIGVDKNIMVLEAKTTQDQHKTLLKHFKVTLDI